MLIPTPFYREPAAKGCFLGCIYNLRAKGFPLFYRAGSSLHFPAMLCPAPASLTLALPDKLLTQDGRLTLSGGLDLIATTKSPFCRVNAVKEQLFFSRCLKYNHSVDFSMAMPLHMPGYAPASFTLTSPESRLIVPPAVITSRRHLSSMPVTVPQISEPPL